MHFVSKKKNFFQFTKESVTKRLRHCYQLKRLAETDVQRCNKTEQDQFHEVVLHCESLVFISTEIFATVGEVESDSTFRETCLETDQQNSSFLIFPFLDLSYFHAFYVFSEDAMRVIPKYYILFPFLVLIFVVYILVTMQPLGLTFILLISLHFFVV